MLNNAAMLTAVAKEQIGGHVDAVSAWRRREGAPRHRGHRTARRPS